MSLVNDMLRDLHERQVREQEQTRSRERMTIVGIPPASSQRPTARLWLSGLAVVVLAGAGGAWIFTALAWQGQSGTAVAPGAPVASVMAPASLIDTSRPDVAETPRVALQQRAPEPPTARVAKVASAGAPGTPVASPTTERAAGGDNGHAPGIEFAAQSAEGPAGVEPATAGGLQTPVAPPAPVEDAPPVKTPVRKSPAELAAEAVERGIEALNSGRLAEAERQFRGAIAHAPGNTAAYELLFSVLVRQARAAAAERVLSAGLEVADNPAVLAKLYARQLVNRAEREEALAVLQQHRPATPRDIEYEAFIAALLQQTEQHWEAATLYRDLLAIRSDQSLWWLGLAISEDALGRHDRALEAYRRARRNGALSAAVDDYAESRIAALNRL